MTPTTTVDPDPDDLNHPLLNLSNLQSRLSIVHNLLSNSLTTNTIIPTSHMSVISDEISAAITAAILNATALISAANNNINNINPSQSHLNFNPLTTPALLKTEANEEHIEDDLDIVELDAVELLAEHLHFCEFCGKGFKRDANLRMHMRAHGNRFKTLEALSKPDKSVDSEVIGVKTTRFSCPFAGCHKKNFSVLADLKSHLKHCGETKWKCSCGTSFSRKDKLFGHIALFEGHMPAMPLVPEVAVEDGGRGKGVALQPLPPVVEGVEGVEWVDDDMLFDGLGSIDDDTLFDGLGSIDDGFCLQNILGAGSMDWNL
ncbi:hypothetical protein M8C21_014410 [Ambrosia artemisiifolia]|uniref:C2H2-type domain-containing protein n=1 Tax=Ambrosia artemisiifolia TaxID=4212 RepID=A0AAD5GCX3_AMBAR|nr:hypothetical protein M8C21_014410 [Ambrosia artemisiifolia]